MNDLSRDQEHGGQVGGRADEEMGVDPLVFLSDGGEMGARMREHDWSATPLGPLAYWPQSLRSLVSACLNSPLLGAVLWGPHLLMLYNDSYIPSMRDRHPDALGRPVADVWGAAWSQVAAPFLDVLRTGRGFEQKRVEIFMVRNGIQEVTFWDITATPVRGENGQVVGLFNQGVEITSRVRDERARVRVESRLHAAIESLETALDERSKALLLYENIVRSHRSPVCAFDKQFRLIAFNQAHSDEFFRIFAHRVQLGDVVHALLPPDQASVMRGFMARALAGETYTVVEKFGDPALADPFWEVSYYPLHDKDGKIMGAFHHAHDISARLRVEADLANAQVALRPAQT